MADIKKIKLGSTEYDIVDAGAARIDHRHDNATSTADGFMSKEDKANHDKMWTVWSADGTGDTLVNKVEEVLEVFENYPEADNLVTVLATKSKVGHEHGVKTVNAAPQGHTHSITINGTTGENSGSAVTVATGTLNASGKGSTVVTGSSGTATVLTGVTADTDNFLKSISGGSGSLTSVDTQSTGDIKYVEAISNTAASASGTAKAGSETHTHNYDKTTGVTLTANDATATGRIQYVQNISDDLGDLVSGATGDIKYVESISSTKASASGTAKAGSETHTHTYDKATGVNLGSNTTSTDGVKYIEDVTHTAATLSGTKTFVTGVTEGSGGLASYDMPSVGHVIIDNSTGQRIPFVSSISSTGASANGTAEVLTGVKVSSTDNFVKTVSGGSGSLEAYDKVEGGNKQVSNGNRVPVVTFLTKSGYTPAGTVTVNLSSGTKPSLGNATTKYLSISADGTTVGANGTGSAAPSGHTHTITVSGTTGASSATAVKAVTGYSSFSGGSLTGTKTFNTDAIKSIGGTKNYGFSTSTSNVMYSPTVTNGVLSWSVTSASTQDAHTGTLASTGTVGFTAASLGTASTADVTPAAHTHSYGSDAALTTGSNSGTAITALTGVQITAQPTITVATSASNTTGSIKYVEAQGTFSAGAFPTVSSASFTGTNSTDVVTGGITYFLDHTHTPASAGSTGDAATAISGNGTATVLTGVKGGTTTAITSYLDHTHVSATSSGTGTVGINGGSISKTTKYFHPSITTESTNSSTPSATTSFVTGVTGGTTTATTKYLTHTPTDVTATTKYLSAAPNNTSTNSGTPSATTQFVTGVTGGTTTATTKYLHHTHTAASADEFGVAVTDVSENGTATAVTGLSTSKLVTTTVAPNEHTHTYGSSTAVVTGTNGGTAVKAVTEVEPSVD